MCDDKLPSAQHVQETAPGLCLEASHTAERTGVEQVGANAKALEKGGEAIYGYGRSSWHRSQNGRKDMFQRLYDNTESCSGWILGLCTEVQNRHSRNRPEEHS